MVEGLRGSHDERIVLAYSGGLDTSVAIPWLAEQYRAEIVTVTLDLGQGSELDDVRERALGARRGARARARRARGVRARLRPAGAAGRRARTRARYPLATALGRPLIAKQLVEIAQIEGATAVAHGCNGDRATTRCASTCRARALDPAHHGHRAGARRGTMSRATRSATRASAAFPCRRRSRGRTRIDANLWGRSIACGVLEDPWQEPPEDIYPLTQVAGRRARHAGVRRDRVRARRAGRDQRRRDAARRADREPRDDRRRARRRPHRHGREPRRRRQVARDLRGAGGRRAAHRASRARSSSSTPRDSSGSPSELGVQYADLVYNGHWFTPTREAIDAFVATVQPRVTGTIRLKLFKGDCRVVGRQSPFALNVDAVDDSPIASNVNARLPTSSAIDVHSLVRPVRRRSRRGRLRLRRVAVRSIAGCSKTTSPAAWRGPRRSRAPAC